MLNFIKKWLSRFPDTVTFLKNWSELITIPVAFLLWAFSAPVLRLIDPTAATFDAGVFQVILFAIIQLLIFSGVVRIIMKMQWPQVDEYLDLYFKIEFNNVRPWERVKLSASVFFLLLFSLVLLSRIL